MAAFGRSQGFRVDNLPHMTSQHMEHRVSQLRHDVDDVYELLDRTNKTVEGLCKTVSAVAMTQRRHGNRLDEIQSAVDLTVGRLDRLEQSHLRLETSHQRLETGYQQIAEVQKQQGTKLDDILAALGARVPAGAGGQVG
jgi:hypothetical protein